MRDVVAVRASSLHTTVRIFGENTAFACTGAKRGFCVHCISANCGFRAETQLLRAQVFGEMRAQMHPFCAVLGKTRVLRAQGENVAFACTVFRRIADFARKRSFCVHRFFVERVHRCTHSGVHVPGVTASSSSQQQLAAAASSSS